MKKGVLFVTDKLPDVNIQKALEPLNIAVINTSSLEEAIQSAKENYFVLALVDDYLLKENAIEELSKLSSVTRFGSLPILIISKRTPEEIFGKKEFDTNLFDVIYKPILPGVIRSKVSFLLEIHSKKKNILYQIDKLESINKLYEREVKYRKELERNLFQAKERVEESERLKTAFLANMSHEIRTPMNAILGFSDLLLENNINDFERNEFIDIIRSSSTSLLSIINDIIDISKIESGDIKVNNRRCYIDKLLVDLKQKYEHTLKKEEKRDVKIILNTPDEIDNNQIVTDCYRLKQILNNLLSNAIKFTESGYIEFGYRKQDLQLEFYVRDTGIGIPENKIDKVFERFIQVDPSSTRQYGGTGLGLTIAKNLTNLLGGTMWVESQPKKETTFYFNIPNIGNISAHEKAEIPSKTKREYDWSQKNFLIVEDNHSSFLYLQASLKRTKAKLVWVKSASAAIDIIASDPNIDLVLLDIQLPDMSGYEAAQKIRAIRSDLKIIAQTAYVMNEDIEKSMNSGCDMHLSKPIMSNALQDAIHNLVK